MLYNVSLDAGGDEFGAVTFNAYWRDDKGVETNIEIGDQGYADAANDNYTLTMGAAGFRRVIDLDTTTMVRSSGLTNSLIVTAGG